MPRKSVEERFLKKVEKTGSCWFWRAGIFNHGYGEFRYKDTMQNAHRVSWQLFKGEIPLGIKVLHSCDNPICVNPDHLFLGTDLDNMRDMYTKHREHILKGSETGNAKINENQVKTIKSMYATGNYSQQKIGDLFGVNQRSISGIVLGKSWKHVE